MKEKYKVGKLVYDGEIYDGMNTDIAELLFYSQWLNKRKAGNNLELC